MGACWSWPQDINCHFVALSIWFFFSFLALVPINYGRTTIDFDDGRRRRKKLRPPTTTMCNTMDCDAHSHSQALCMCNGHGAERGSNRFHLKNSVCGFVVSHTDRRRVAIIFVSNTFHMCICPSDLFYLNQKKMVIIIKKTWLSMCSYKLGTMLHRYFIE